ncbi:hypothetical protein LH462_03375 [Laribacter hongkongensis]|uniref:Uncharacterized protein n=1 Tax=Laribacter hongkongensis TaxID=168471 RepID=A0ABD4SSY5_9NEIS|nr:hypothetical protein [Laribacter hongkongensis]MCG9026890.1 hypothetical protein [Laribacter hongkongensis]MCG9102769.1 hypothetical protein [Laribacter hongkongensis]MCG9113054.1 hypothetical protein [Laribacter hongkongensis]
MKFTSWSDLPRIQDNGLPPRAYYSLDDAAKILGCTKLDVLHYAATERLEIVASALSLNVSCALQSVLDEDVENDDRPDFLDFFYLHAAHARELEITGKTLVNLAHAGYSIEGPFGLDYYIPWLEEKYVSRNGCYRFIKNDDTVDRDDFSFDFIEELEVTHDAIYVMPPALQRFKQNVGSVSLWDTQNYLSHQATATQPQQLHGNSERHARNRESVLKAAMCCKANWPSQCGTTNRELARLIDEKAGLFWPESCKPPLSLDRIERLLGETQKIPGGVK